MRKTIIVLKRNCFLCNGYEYKFNQFGEVTNLLTSNMKIIILEEELYSKHFSINLKGSKLSKFIQNQIDSNFQLNTDILYDYEQNKNIVAMYSLKGGKRIEKIINRAKKLEVKPMQFIIKSTVQKIIGNKILNSKILVEFEGIYYYVSFKEGLFCYGFVEKEKNIIIDRIFNTENEGEIYVDNKIADKLELRKKFKILEINLEDLLNDQIYQKQKFYFRKVL